MDLGKDLVAASATPLVLAILAEGDSYGYAIIKRVAELSGGHLQWTDGMLYPVLHRLERQGYVAAKWSAAENGRRPVQVAVTSNCNESPADPSGAVILNTTGRNEFAVSEPMRASIPSEITVTSL